MLEIALAIEHLAWVERHAEKVLGPRTVRPSVRTAVADMNEVIEHTNSSRCGLGATVFSRRHGPAIARRIRCGAVSVNAFVAHATIAALPLGGTGQSGFGRVHGADGLRELASARATTVQRFPAPLPLTSSRCPPWADALVRALIAVRHGGR